jgi:hypothetical protein
MRTPFQFLFPLILVLTLLLSSCAPEYIPNVINTPLLHNKGELQVSASAGISGFDPQAAYAVTDNFGLMLNASFSNRSSNTGSDFHKHNFVEFGLGYYKVFEEYFCFEVYGGGGFGNNQGKYTTGWGISESNNESTRFFVQPAIGISTEFVDLALASRLAQLSIHSDEGHFRDLYIEPALVLKLGYQYLKFITQVGFSVPINDNFEIDYQPFIFSIGLQANLFRNWEDEELPGETKEVSSSVF